MRTILSILVAACVAVSAVACASGSQDNPNYVYALSSEPQNPLVPANTNETNGGRVIDLLFSGLVGYDVSGNAYNDLAASITQEKPDLYKVILKPGEVFSDGTPVLAHNFVDAWNYAVANSLINASFFESIEGYREGAPSMSGLKVINDLSFTIKLAQREADFPLRLGHSAFFPLPDSAYKDMKEFGEHPIGNGPYLLRNWLHNESLTVEPNPRYKGSRHPKNEGIQFVFYAKPDAAYADLLAGNLDVMDQIPDSSFAAFEQELQDRAVNQPAAIFQSFTIPESLPHFSGKEGNLRRQALSMAVDRPLITEMIFSNTRTPATDFSSPVLPGFTGKVPGSEVTTFNPDKARDLWAQADEISPWEGTFSIAYNADGGHQVWVDAVSNSLRNVLGIEAVGAPYPDFKSLRDEVVNRTITTAFRTGWQADYPSIGNFLIPTFTTSASSNDGDYSNPEFDAAMNKAGNASSPEESIALYNKAQEILFQDLPAIPLWYSNVTGGYSEDASNVEFNWKSQPEYHNIVINRG